MWIATNKGFFSVVASDRDPDVLMVRARFQHDLRRAFGPLLERLQLEVYYSHDRDYGYRCFIPREEFSREIARQVSEIRYGNFKDSVTGPGTDNLKDLYGEIWFCGARAQDREPPPEGHVLLSDRRVG